MRPLLVIAFVLFSIRSSLADWNDVPTGSMDPTILVGDRVLVNKLAYDLKVPFTTRHLAEWGNPKRGDIVVFYSPADGKRLVKRVAAVPGDTIQMQNERLVLNGTILDYAQQPESPANRAVAGQSVFGTEFLPGKPHTVAFMPMRQAMRDFGPVRLGANEFFMLGDNRDNSFDSRYFGPVARDRILGRAEGVAFSLDHDRYWLPRTDRILRALN